MADGDRCRLHDPKHARAAQAARRKGGRNSRKTPLVLPPELVRDGPKTIPEVIAFVANLAARVVRGELEPKLASTAGYLADVIRRALQEQGPNGDERRPIQIVFGGPQPRPASPSPPSSEPSA